MSRSTVAKSRADKGGKSGYGSAPTPAVAHEIVAGKFNDQDWNFMIEHDDSDEFLQDIVEEIYSSALEKIYQNYLQKQLIPHTVLQAKEAMLEIIEWQFLAHDEGENNVETNPNWVEDEEPECAVTDCWAQGSVPINIYPSTPKSIGMEVLDEEPAAQQEIADGSREVPKPEVEAKEENSSIVIEESEIAEPSKDKHEKKDKSEHKKKQQRTFKPHYGPLRQTQADKMTESLEQGEMELLYAEMQTPLPPKTPETAIFHMPNSCHSIIKLQAGRPPGTRDVIYDHAGNVVSITKLNPERLPNHRVRTGYHVVDPQVEAAQARLEAMRTGRHLKIKKTSPSTYTSKGEYNLKRGKKKQPTTSTAVVRSSRDDIAQLPPPLIDAMELAPGVVVREGDRIKRGPKQPSSKSGFSSIAHKKLRPVVVNGGTNVFSVQDLLGTQQPIIRPLGAQQVPPIMPHPPTQKAS